MPTRSRTAAAAATAAIAADTPELREEVELRVREAAAVLGRNAMVWMIRHGIGRLAATEMLGQAGLPAPASITQPYTLTVTYSGVYGDSEETVRAALRGVGIGERARVGERDAIVTPTVTVRADAPELPGHEGPRTMAGELAAAPRIRQQEEEAFRQLTMAAEGFGWSLTEMWSAIGVVPPATREYVVLVPMRVSAWDEEAARQVGLLVTGRPLTAPAYGQYDYVGSPLPETVEVRPVDEGV